MARGPSLNIRHSVLMNEFVSVWFETCVDGQLRYETFVDFLRTEWYTRPFGVEGKILLRGQLAASVRDAAVVDNIKPYVEAAIKRGRI
jgi:hypothetical protein